jgi:SAM-dependent methyltransferase
MTTYNSSFFARQAPESYQSAKEVVPLLLEHYRPTSAVDVGCGTGSWAKALQEHGIEDVIGIDGDYVDQEFLLIDHAKFVSIDLARSFGLERKYELVVSLEVAEHLPYYRADGFVRDLTTLGDVVLFSAAQPYQSGTDHLNENWLEYWAILFSRHDFVAIDLVRPAIWNNKRIAFWYRQNIILFVKKQKTATLFPTFRNDVRRPLSYVHPHFFLVSNWWRRSRECVFKKVEHDLTYYYALVDAYLQGVTDLPSQPRLYQYQSGRDTRWESLRRKVRDLLPPA